MKSFLRLGLAVGLGVLTWILGIEFVQSIVNGVFAYYLIDKGNVDAMFTKIKDSLFKKSIPGVTVPTQGKSASIPGVTVPTQG